MDEVLLRRMVGLVTLAVGAFLLSWLLPRPGLERLQAGGERVVTMDLTRPDSLPEERSAEVADDAPVAGPSTSVEPTPDAAPAAAAVNEPQVDARAPALQAEPEPVPKPEITPAPTPESKPEPRTEPTPEPKPVPNPVPKPVPKVDAPAPPKAAAPAPKPAPAPSGGGAVAVQAGAFSHLDKAEGVRARAASLGLKCSISPVETAKGTLYRLRCGPYADRVAADAAVRKLTSAGIAAQVVGAGR